MSCRETRVGSALTTIARLESGLSDVQTLSAFHAQRAAAQRDIPAPTAEEFSAFIDEQVADVERNENFTDARRRSLLARLESAREERVDGRTWAALRRIRPTLLVQRSLLDRRIEGIARRFDITEDEARTRLNRVIEETPRGRRGATPEGYDDAIASRARSEGLPTDPATVMAINRLEAEGLRAHADRVLAGPQRIVRQSVTWTARPDWAIEGGYDPEGGRLEIVAVGPSGTTERYAYRGVPADLATEALGSDGMWAMRGIRSNTAYQYSTREEADLDSAQRRCAECGQFAAAGHHCPARVAREEAAAAAARAAEEAAERARADAIAVEERARAEREEAAARAEAAAASRPPVREAREIGLWGYGRRIRPNRDAEDGRGDCLWVTQMTRLRAEAVNGPVRASVQYAFDYRYNEGDDGLPAGVYARVTGTAVFDRPERGAYTVTDPQLRCNCRVFRDNGDCTHITYALNRASAAFVPAPSRGTRGPLTEEDIARAQRAAEEALRRDWTRREDTLAEARATWQESAPQDRYSERFESFEEDYNAALARKAAGEAPIPYMTSNALGGRFTRESGKGFGVELEFDFPAGVSRYEALAAIGRDLYAAGLTNSQSQQPYGASRRRGYVDFHARGWSYEQDCTVSGEIVSPVMFDEPETWENIAKVCEIVKRHGGVANVKTGSHVHVSSPNTTVATATELRRTVNQHEDVLYRLSTNPERGKHRPMRWCGPNSAVPAAGYSSVAAARVGTTSHGFGLNLQSVNGEGSDHPEIRHWDGTMDPAVIQAQIKISTAMVEAAERNGANGGSPLREREAVGSHALRLRSVRGRSRRALTSEELKDDSATARSFIDSLFTRREDKAQAAALFAVTKWSN